MRGAVFMAAPRPCLPWPYQQSAAGYGEFARSTIGWQIRRPMSPNWLGGLTRAELA